MMKRIVKPAPIMLAAALLSLAACGDDPAPAAQPSEQNGDHGANTAAGDVRGGEISDAMLPLETVRSQAPSMAIESNGDGDDSSVGDDSSEDASDDAAEDTPANNATETEG